MPWHVEIVVWEKDSFSSTHRARFFVWHGHLYGKRMGFMMLNASH